MAGRPKRRARLAREGKTPTPRREARGWRKVRTKHGGRFLEHTGGGGFTVHSDRGGGKLSLSDPSTGEHTRLKSVDWDDLASAGTKLVRSRGKLYCAAVDREDESRFRDAGSRGRVRFVVYEDLELLRGQDAINKAVLANDHSTEKHHGTQWFEVLG